MSQNNNMSKYGPWGYMPQPSQPGQPGQTGQPGGPGPGPGQLTWSGTPGRSSPPIGMRGLYGRSARSWPSVATSYWRGPRQSVGPNIGTGPFPGYDCLGTCTCLCGCREEVEGWMRACNGCKYGEHYDPNDKSANMFPPSWQTKGRVRW